MTVTATAPTTDPTAGAPAALGGTEVIDPAGLRDLLEADPAALVLDVRTGGEFAGVHIPGSRNVPLGSLDERARAVALVDRPMVVVCRSGERAERARATLTAAGATRLRVLVGGVDGWISSGGEVTRGRSTTWAMDRQIRLVAGSISLVGIVGSIFVPRAKWLSGAVATGLTFSALSDTCALGAVLARLPYNAGGDVDEVIAEMRAGR
ncbi:rhodanese-like domain-containing protein [Ilumatobacter sp.]|uniref:rhodanese-like domain-containing protein n=1 Tax=Ilumatobacter sp. TaxID=1967498 RepID=UPI003B51CABB